jgi:hypothetical protein
VQVSFHRGSVVFLAAREEAFSHYTLELVAANGRLRYEQGGQRVEWQATGTGALKGYQVLDSNAETLLTGINRYQWHVAEHIAAVLAGTGDHALCTGTQALSTLESQHTIMALRNNIV